MKFLVIGNGGREHAIIWKLAQSPKVDKIYCTLGNAGISKQAEIINIKVDDFESLANFAIENKIDYTFVGPEVPLALGVVDFFNSKGLKIFGPSKKGALLEASKSFAKKKKKKYNVPTAAYHTFTDYNSAKQFLENGGLDFDIRNFLDYVENNNEKYDFQNNITTANIFFSTIHGVKGLEYDNVVLLDFDEKNLIKTDKMMFFNTFIGQDSKKYFFYKTKQIIDNTCSLDNLQKAIKHEENKVILEKWRLLYVAITRAKRRFYYFGNFEKSQFGKFFNDYLTNIKI